MHVHMRTQGVAAYPLRSVDDMEGPTGGTAYVWRTFNNRLYISLVLRCGLMFSTEPSFAPGAARHAAGVRGDGGRDGEPIPVLCQQLSTAGWGGGGKLGDWGCHLPAVIQPCKHAAYAYIGAAGGGQMHCPGLYLSQDGHMAGIVTRPWSVLFPLHLLLNSAALQMAVSW